MLQSCDPLNAAPSPRVLADSRTLWNILTEPPVATLVPGQHARIAAVNATRDFWVRPNLTKSSRYFCCGNRAAALFACDALWKPPPGESWPLCNDRHPRR